MLVSTNGIDWSSRSVPPSGSTPRQVHYANGRFVAAGHQVIASEDGLNWVEVPLPRDFSGYEVAYGNGVWVFLERHNIYVSADLKTWQTVASPASNGFYSAQFGNGIFVALSISGIGDNIFTSTDGLSWKAHGRLEILRPLRIPWGNGYFVTGGGGRRAYSRDGASWTIVSSSASDYRAVPIRFLNGRFVATGFRTIFESDPIVHVTLRSPQQLEITGAPGQTLRLESTASLNSPVWNSRESVTLQDGQSTTSIALSPTDELSQSFFRVVVVQ